MRAARKALVWLALALAVAVPIAAAAASPLLAWREPIYIAAGFAGIVALCLMLIQPMLIGEHIPGLEGYRGKRIHRWVGGLLVIAVVVHVGALWITSPPDVVDALLFASPTPFSVWGVIAMWAIFGAALLAAVRRRIRLRPDLWRLSHTSLVVITVLGTVIHALLIEGTMEMMSKIALCVLVLAVTSKVVVDRRVWAMRMPWHRRRS